MYTILDIHTHHPAPQPNAVVCVSPDDFNPIENQLYSVGIHPWKTADALSDDILEKLEAAAEHPQVVAIGECGSDKIQGGPLFRQMQVMRRQIELSEKVGKPLIIHNVHAQDIIIGVKKDLNPTQPWLVHGFRGKPTIAKMLTDTGIWLSFNDKFNDMSVTETPIQFMLAETDESETPIADIITKLSSLKGEDLTATISENAARFLSLNS